MRRLPNQYTDLKVVAIYKIEISNSQRSLFLVVKYNIFHVSIETSTMQVGFTVPANSEDVCRYLERNIQGIINKYNCQKVESLCKLRS